MVVKGTLLYKVIRSCGKCGERKKTFPGQIYCLDCGQRFRTRPKSRKNKEKYITFEGY